MGFEGGGSPPLSVEAGRFRINANLRNGSMRVLGMDWGQYRALEIDWQSEKVIPSNDPYFPATRIHLNHFSKPIYLICKAASSSN